MQTVVRLGALDRLLLAIIAVALVYLCVRGTASQAPVQADQGPVRVHVVAGPPGGLPVTISDPVDVRIKQKASDPALRTTIERQIGP